MYGHMIGTWWNASKKFQENVYDKGHEDMNLEACFTASETALQSKRALEPLEECFDRPAGLVELGDGEWREIKAVGDEVILLAILGAEADPAHGRLHLRLSGAEQDGAVMEHAPGPLGPFDAVFLSDLIHATTLEPTHEEDAGGGRGPCLGSR